MGSAYTVIASERISYTLITGTDRNTREAEKYHLRPALVGDVCILLEPTNQDEIQSLHQYQLQLQKTFNGTPTHHVHLTCQRFAMAEDYPREVLFENLRSAMADITPFPLTAVDIQKLYIPRIQSTILKWRVELTLELSHLTHQVELAVKEAGLVSSYIPGWVPSLVTALENLHSIPSKDTSISKEIFPHHLFIIHKLVISRIISVDQYKLLGTIYLPTTDASD